MASVSKAKNTKYSARAGGLRLFIYENSEKPEKNSGN
jgi:hypothetical protein